MREWLLIIAQWCASSPYPYKTAAQCKTEIYRCVLDANYTEHKCFAPPEELILKEKTR